jgi:hypothetical protein
MRLLFQISCALHLVSVSFKEAQESGAGPLRRILRRNITSAFGGRADSSLISSRRRPRELMRGALRPASARSFASDVLAPALSEPKARSRAPARRRCDGVRCSRPTPCRQPEHRSRQTRSAAAASFARCIIEDIYYRQSGGAGSGGSPDKAGAYCEELKGLFGLVGKANGTSQSYPYCTVRVRSLLI